MMMMMTTRKTRTITITQVSHFGNLIETWGFCEDIKKITGIIAVIIFIDVIIIVGDALYSQSCDTLVIFVLKIFKMY